MFVSKDMDLTQKTQHFTAKKLLYLRLFNNIAYFFKLYRFRICVVVRTNSPPRVTPSTTTS